MLRNSKIMEKYIRKVTRVGKRSLSINIPAEIVDQLKIREKQKLTITTKGRSIVIKDWK
jgi:antitoxin component of MazEF toxin-antitoxin module